MSPRVPQPTRLGGTRCRSEDFAIGLLSGPDLGYGLLVAMISV